VQGIYIGSIISFFTIDIFSLMLSPYSDRLRADCKNATQWLSLLTVN